MARSFGARLARECSTFSADLRATPHAYEGHTHFLPTIVALAPWRIYKNSPLAASTTSTVNPTHNRLRHRAAYARAAARAEEDLALEYVWLEYVGRVRDRGGVGFEGHGGSV